MEKNLKRIFINGKKNEGGILLTVLGLLLVFSLLFSFRLEGQRFENQMRYDFQEYYHGKALRNLTVPIVLKKHPRPAEKEIIRGQVQFEQGQVAYEYHQNKIVLNVTLVSGKKMNEIEELPVGTEATTTTTESKKSEPKT